MKVSHVKTGISIDEGLFKEAEALAEKMEISRSQLFSRAVEEFVRERENRELLERLNEAHAGGLDEEEQEHLERAMIHHGRLLEENGNEWRAEG